MVKPAPIIVFQVVKYSLKAKLPIFIIRVTQDFIAIRYFKSHLQFLRFHPEKT